MKLYIVEDSGDYYVVKRIGVFSSMEKAEAAIKRLGSGWELGIVEVELDLIDPEEVAFYDKYRVPK
jgi:hypothetical protein